MTWIRHLIFPVRFISSLDMTSSRHSCWFVSCTSCWQAPLSTTSQRFSYGNHIWWLGRSRNSLSRSRNTVYIVTWSMIMLEEAIRRWKKRDEHGQQRYSDRLWYSNCAWLVLRGANGAFVTMIYIKRVHHFIWFSYTYHMSPYVPMFQRNRKPI